MYFAASKTPGPTHSIAVLGSRKGFLGQVLGAPNLLAQERADVESALGAEGWVRPWQQERDRSVGNLEIQSLRIRMAEELLEARAKRRAMTVRTVAAGIVALGLWLLAAYAGELQALVGAWGIGASVN